MAGSVGVAVRAAVVDGLADVLTLDGEVSYGFTFQPGLLEQVYTGRSSGETPPASLRSGRNYRDEQGTFDLNILVRVPGGSLLEADERCDEIASVVEEWIADRKSNQLGVSGLNYLLVTRWDADYVQIDAGMCSIRTLTVAWRARLT